MTKEETAEEIIAAEWRKEVLHLTSTLRLIRSMSVNAVVPKSPSEDIENFSRVLVSNLVLIVRLIDRTVEGQKSAERLTAALSVWRKIMKEGAPSPDDLLDRTIREANQRADGFDGEPFHIRLGGRKDG